MPYSRLSQVPPSLRGAGLSLRQANQWGRVYDAVKRRTGDASQAARIAWYRLRRGGVKKVLGRCVEKAQGDSSLNAAIAAGDLPGATSSVPPSRPLFFSPGNRRAAEVKGIIARCVEKAQQREAGHFVTIRGHAVFIRGGRIRTGKYRGKKPSEVSRRAPRRLGVVSPRHAQRLRRREGAAGVQAGFEEALAAARGVRSPDALAAVRTQLHRYLTAMSPGKAVAATAKAGKLAEFQPHEKGVPPAVHRAIGRHEHALQVRKLTRCRGDCDRVGAKQFASPLLPSESRPDVEGIVWG